MVRIVNERQMRADKHRNEGEQDNRRNKGQARRDHTRRRRRIAQRIGARSYNVIQHAQRGGRQSPQPTQLLKRKPPKLAAVALANKTARIAWKLMVTGKDYAAAKAAPAALAGVG
jgi:hypothetical protein